MNKTALVEKVRSLSKKTSVPSEILYAQYFFDSFLKRVTDSPYAGYLILKGGFLLSAYFGNQRRSTVDIDFSLKGKNLNEAYITQMMTEIKDVDLKDGIRYEIGNVTKIRPNDVYGGFRIPFIGYLENIRQPFAVDVATGDPITPGEVTFTYQPLFETIPLSILSYTLETVVAEKLQTILTRQETNGRSKDLYDLYVLFGLQIGKIDVANLKRAVTTTFSYRKALIDKETFNQAVKHIENSIDMKNRWDLYSKTHHFAKGIPFSEVLLALKKCVALIINPED